MPSTLAVTGSTFLHRKYFFNAGLGVMDSVRMGTKTSGSRFDANLRDTSSVFASSDTVSRSYLSWGPPSAIHAHAPVLQSFDRSLEYDQQGRIRHQFTDPEPEQFSRIFGYDGLGRVVRDTGANMPYDECTYDPNSGWHCPDSTLSVDSVRSLVYDAVGNVLRDSIWAPYFDTAHVSTGSYTADNRITSFNGCSYQTDADGNVTSRTCGSTTTTFWWSSENRLDSLAVGSVKTRLYYDGSGRLVKRDANGTIHYFWWDGDNLYAEMNGTGGKLMEYAYAGVDNPRLLATADSAVYLVRRDGLGNVLGLVDSAKAVRADYDWYTLWGSGGTTEHLPTGATNRARFKGALWMGDVGAELYYMRARWYEPRTGRFLSEDPIGLAGGINPYAFAGGNPVSGGDPFGLYCPTTPPFCCIEVDADWPDHLTDDLAHLQMLIDGSGHNDIYPAGGSSMGRSGVFASPAPEDVGDAAVRDCRIAIAKLTLTAVFDAAFVFEAIATKALERTAIVRARVAFRKDVLGITAGATGAYNASSAAWRGVDRAYTKMLWVHEGGALGLAGAIDRSGNLLSYVPILDLLPAGAEVGAACWNPGGHD